jgi:predicted type IV restriction endonuclease
VIIIKVPKTVSSRLIKEVPKFQRILDKAKSRDVNESDTVTIIADILSNVFGFDKYNEITSEQAVRGTYCDLAIKLDDKIKYLIEVKAVGIDLKADNLRQATNYGANSGIQWIILTNGISWEIHRMKFSQPVDHELVFKLDFNSMNPKKMEDQEKIYLLCKEGTTSEAIEEFHDRAQMVNRFMISAISLTQPVIGTIRRELRRISPGLKVTEEEIKNLLVTEVIKREVTEGEEFEVANKKVKKASRKNETRPAQSSVVQNIPPTEDKPLS